MNAKGINKIIQLQVKQALYREDGKWYHNLTEFPGVLFDKNGYITFQIKEDYISHPNLQIIVTELISLDGIDNLTIPISIVLYLSLFYL